MNRTAVLFIDFQRDFLEADGRLTVGKVRAKALLDQAAQLLEAAREGRYDAVFVINEFSPDDRIGNFLRNHSALRGRPGAEMDPRIGAEGFPLFTKSASDGFTNPKFLAHLREQAYTELALTGVMAEDCVRATANSALRHGFRVKLLADAVESNQEWKRMCCDFVVEPKIGLDDWKFSSSPRTDRE